jgi:hypothetical protein
MGVSYGFVLVCASNGMSWYAIGDDNQPSADRLLDAAARTNLAIVARRCLCVLIVTAQGRMTEGAASVPLCSFVLHVRRKCYGMAEDRRQ